MSAPIQTPIGSPIQSSGVKPRSTSLLAAWSELLRLRIALMVMLMAALGALLAIRQTGRFDAQGMAHAAIAVLLVTLVTASASILNQVLERGTDGLMERTRHRPLVTGRVGVSEAIGVATLCGVVGVGGLAYSFNLLAALLCLATLALYVAIYTPLKQVSTLNTAVGALPGAAPPLLGYAAVAGDVGPWAWALFATLFAWQFPHFMAIAWMYRKDYAAAGHRMVPSVPDSEGMAGRQALLYSLAIIPVSLMPLWKGIASPVYGIGVILLGVMYLVPAWRFFRREDRPRARTLMFVSLVYLPLLFFLILADPLVLALLQR